MAMSGSKVVHVLAVISWMAGLFYLPRLFVYHAENIGKSELVAGFQGHGTPASQGHHAAGGCGGRGDGCWLIWLGSWYGPVPVWLWLKLLLVLACWAFTACWKSMLARFRDGRETRSGRYFRIINEIPTLLLIGIVILVIVKPF